MAPEENLTYFGYREGYDCGVLQLGSLVWDYANPLSKRPYLAQIESDDQLSKWIVRDKRTDCYMKTDQGRGVTVGAGLLDYAQINFQNDKKEQRIIMAKTGSKTFLLEPHKYLEKSLLASTEAQTWLSTRLAVSRQRKLINDLTFNHPKIWMLTGIYVMENAATMTILSRNTKTGGTLAAPIPDPLGIGALLDLKIGAKVELGSDYLLESGSVFQGSRVWAAQYHEVRADYVVAKDGQAKMPAQVFLTDKVSFRNGRGESNLAQLDLAEEVSPEESFENGQEYTDADWKDFDKRLDNLLAQFDDDESSDDEDDEDDE